MSGAAIIGASWAHERSALVRAAKASASPVGVKAVGVVGSRVPGWLNSPATQSAAAQGRHLFVLEMGGNGVSSSDTISDANRALLDAGAASVSWCIVTPGVGVIEARQRSRENILNAGVRTVELGILSARDVSRDGVHPTRRAYERMGSRLGRSILLRSHGGPGAMFFASLAALWGLFK